MNTQSLITSSICTSPGVYCFAQFPMHLQGLASCLRQRRCWVSAWQVDKSKNHPTNEWTVHCLGDNHIMSSEYCPATSHINLMVGWESKKLTEHLKKKKSLKPCWRRQCFAVLRVKGRCNSWDMFQVEGRMLCVYMLRPKMLQSPPLRTGPRSKCTEQVTSSFLA